MKLARQTAISLLLLIAAMSFVPQLFPESSYAQQFRELPDGGPSRHHLLGTDELGRDRLAQLLYGSRISLLLAPAAALLSTLLAALIGGGAGFAGGLVEKAVMAVADLFLSLPWMFLLITMRALLPLNVTPFASVVFTFLLMGSLGWAAAARVVCADARSLGEMDCVLLARASGVHNWRLLWRHLLPNLSPVLLAQFWISIPVFILTEANLGMLGLGVEEPLPSWGGLLRELESLPSFTHQPWLFVPFAILVVVVSSFHLALNKQEQQV